MILIEQSTGFAAQFWGVTKLRSGEQVTLVDFDAINNQVMVESLRNDDVYLVPLCKTNLEIKR